MYPAFVPLASVATDPRELISPYFRNPSRRTLPLGLKKEYGQVGKSYRLGDGEAQYMGDGLFLICQPSDQGPQDVAVSESDLARLVEAEGYRSIRLDDGVAHYMGDDVWALVQPSDQGPQDVVVSKGDLRTLQAALG